LRECLFGIEGRVKMTANHRYFEILCALAASDELAGSELAELNEHSLACVSCKNRLNEMARINAYLLLSHAFTLRKGRMPQGMQERFIARAIKEGVPLKSPSIGKVGALGLASALFAILLVTAGVVKTGPFSRNTVDTSHFDAAQLSKPAPLTSQMTQDSTMGLVQKRRDRSRGAKSKISHVGKAQPTLPAGVDIFENHYFAAGLSAPHFTLATMSSDMGRLSSLPYTPSRFRLSAPPALIRDSALQLLAASDLSVANPIPSEFTFATPAAHPVLDIDPSRMPPILALRGTPLKFHLAESVTQ
jgi:hypothetical protein